MNTDNVLQPVMPVAPVAPRKGWWGRNWKWFVPTGCLTMLALVAGVIFLLLSLIFGVMKSSDAYKQAMVKVRADSAVTTTLGTPIKEGFFTSGSVNVSGSSGSANLAIPISGPKGSGTVYVEATKSAGKWSFTKLVVAIDEADITIDLLEGSPQ
jgi:hypothetical protein